MHEIHLMQQVIRMVEAVMRDASEARASVVRVKINARSHLLDHEGESIRSAFSLASRGTAAEGAALEVIRVPVGVRCRACLAPIEVDAGCGVCPACGSPAIELEEVPEMVLHEIVVG